MLSELGRAFAGETTLSYRQGAALVAGSGVLFSFTSIAFRGIEEASDWQFLALRGGSMALVLALVVLARRRTRRPVRWDVVDWRIVLAGLLLGSMSLLFILALSRTTVALTLVLLAIAPFSGAFWGRLVLGERVTRTTMIAMLLALVGIAIMVGQGFDSGETVGVVFAALIPLVLGLYNVLVRSADVSVDPVIPGIIGGTALTAVAGTVALVQDGLDISARDLLLGCLAGTIFLGLGIPLFNLGHRSVPTAQVSLLNLTEIVLSPIWVWIWPGETPSTATLIGGAVVLTAVAYLVTNTEEAAGDRSARGGGGRRTWRGWFPSP